MLGRNIARLDDCTGFKNTGVFEDEGQFLQDVYLTASAYGGSSRVGFDPRAHRTEKSSLLTPANVSKLKASWDARKHANEALLTSGFSKLIFRRDSAPSCARESCWSAMEDGPNVV